MNKEEEVIIKILEKYKYDCDGTELKNIVQEALISFMDYTKGQDLDEINRFYRIYALMYWAIKDLQSQLDIANKNVEKEHNRKIDAQKDLINALVKLDKIKEIMQQMIDGVFEENGIRYLKDKAITRRLNILLSIIGGE